MGQFALDQDSFRIRNDDGGETGASWAYAVNTNGSMNAYIPFRLRFLLQEYNGKAGADKTFRLYVSYNSGSWLLVQASHSQVRPANSQNDGWTLTDEDATTQQIGAGTFITGAWNDDVLIGENNQIDFAGDDETEIEVCLQMVAAAVSHGDTLEFELRYGDLSQLESYTNRPTVTVNKPAALLDQDGFRIRDDDGNETGATWLYALNTNGSSDTGVNLRLRFLIQEYNSGGADDQIFQLFYSKNGGAYTRVTALSSNVRTFLSSWFADEDATTQQLGSGTFVTGAMGESDQVGDFDQIDITPNSETEVEWCIQFIDADVSNGDYFDFEMRDFTGAALDTYTRRPRITISTTATATGTLDVTLADMTLTGVGKVKVEGTADITLAAMTLAGTGEVDVTGSLDVTLDAMTLAGSADVKIQGSLDTTFDAMTLAGIGTVTTVTTGTLDVTLADMTLAGVGAVAVKGSADLTLAAMTLAGSADVKVQGTADVTLAAMTLAGIGEVAIAGSLDVTFADMTLTGTGLVGAQIVYGTLDITFDNMTLAGIGEVAISGSADITFGEMTLAGLGQVWVQGSADIAFDALTLAGSAKAKVQGSADLALDAMTFVGAGIVVVSGVLDTTLDDCSLVAAGTVAIAASADIQLAEMVLAGSGEVLITGAGTITFEDMTLTGVGKAGDFVEGTLDITFEDMVLAGVGIAVILPVVLIVPTFTEVLSVPALDDVLIVPDSTDTLIVPPRD